VTDHVTLLMNHSKLYHYLSPFETDFKRKIAMETRRIDMLEPLLLQLNKAAYEGLHKSVSMTNSNVVLHLDRFIIRYMCLPNS
jgi:hypothetical protein